LFQLVLFSFFQTISPSALTAMLWGVYTIQQTSSKLPANVMLDVCWKFAGRSLDRVNTLLTATVLFAVVNRLLIKWPNNARLVLCLPSPSRCCCLRHKCPSTTEVDSHVSGGQQQR